MRAAFAVAIGKILRESGFGFRAACANGGAAIARISFENQIFALVFFRKVHGAGQGIRASYGGNIGIVTLREIGSDSQRFVGKWKK